MIFLKKTYLLNGNLYEKKIKVVFSFCLTILVIIYSSTYINTFPVNEGWGIMYVEQIFQGKFPYRDFYYYLPPLNLLIDALFWKISFGYLIIYRIFWLLQRVLIVLLVFNKLCDYFRITTSFIACILSVFLATASTYDLLGDYNQTAALLAVVMAYFTTNFVEQNDEGAKLRNLGYAGGILGLMFLTKQTIFLASTIVHFITLATLCWKEK